MLPVFLCLLSVGLPVSASAVTELPVPSGYREVAGRYGISPESLYLVALTETAMAPHSLASVSSGAGPVPAVERPWPWTLNVAGKSYRYASRLQAWEALQRFLKTYPRKRIDVGIAQVNLGWNGRYFASTWDALEPYTNLNVAAAILRECHVRHPESWLAAVGCYHHPAGGAPAVRYASIVKKRLARLSRVAPSPNRVALVWTEPRRPSP